MIEKEEKNSRKWKEEILGNKWCKIVKAAFKCDPCMIIMNKPVTLPCVRSFGLSKLLRKILQAKAGLKKLIPEKQSTEIAGYVVRTAI